MNEQTVLDVAKNNPGAMWVLLELGTEELARSLESQGVTGADIWLLYKDECGENIELTRAVIEAGTAHATLCGNRCYSGHSDTQSE
jgi:hypothetical protein